MKKFEPLLKVLRNKYALVLIGTIVWMMFFDRYNIPSQLQLAGRISQLEEDRDFYQSEMERIGERRDALFSSMEELERYAREKYYMKKEDEDLFIIMEPSKK